jgi:hypothetical protein
LLSQALGQALHLAHAAGREDNVVAIFGKFGGEGFADAGRRAGDESGFANSGVQDDVL